MKKLVIGLTGASGVIYGLRLIDQCSLLREVYGEVHVVYTKNAHKVADYELGVDLIGKLKENRCINAFYRDDDWDSPLASSSNLVNTDCVIAPASLNTVAKLSTGIQDNLLLRIALSIMRIGGRLILVIRETPLSAIDLRNMYRLALSGAVILPASPAFYIKPNKVDDLIDFIVGKVMDVLGVKHSLYKRWRSV